MLMKLTYRTLNVQTHLSHAVWVDLTKKSMFLSIQWLWQHRLSRPSYLQAVALLFFHLQEQLHHHLVLHLHHLGKVEGLLHHLGKVEGLLHHLGALEVLLHRLGALEALLHHQER